MNFADFIDLGLRKQNTRTCGLDDVVLNEFSFFYVGFHQPVQSATQSKGNRDRSLEMEIWHDLANIYTTLSQWRDAEVCLSKSQAIHPFSASRFHSTGLLHESRGLHQEALKSFRKALDIDPNHVASLISTACVLMQLGGQSSSIARGLLTDALRLDRTNPSAWYNLGLLYKADAGTSAWEAAECFEAAAILEESSPIEPFR
ncbi:hypothetical protein L6164_025896 [Bauhinia variegata]|uniref:Uncharacterized protein n=1 Tax=Bauhinia variegata TaxID=167791 RepID=A0ACB9M1U0_BAUVA|nr:hypothetical protein L6164_025896 [Bauhinia variegata]